MTVGTMPANTDDLIYAPIPDQKPAPQEKASNTGEIDPVQDDYFPLPPCDVGDLYPVDPDIFGDGLPFWRMHRATLSALDLLHQGCAAETRHGLRELTVQLDAIGPLDWHDLNFEGPRPSSGASLLATKYREQAACEPVWDVILK